MIAEKFFPEIKDIPALAGFIETRINDAKTELKKDINEIKETLNVHGEGIDLLLKDL